MFEDAGLRLWVGEGEGQGVDEGRGNRNHPGGWKRIGRGASEEDRMSGVALQC